MLTSALRLAGSLALVLAASAAPSDAQGLEQPLRSSPVEDSSRTTQVLTVTASALGGYDDRLTAQGNSIESLDTAEGGYTGFTDLSLRFWRGRPSRSFSLDGSVYMLSYSNLSIDSPVGGQVGVDAATTFGRSNRLEITQKLSTDPYVAFGAFGPLRQDLGPGVGPDADPVNGLTPNRSWGSFTSASADWRLAQRTTLTTDYSYSQNEYIGNAGFDNRTHAAELAFDRSLTRAVALTASYRYADTLLDDPVLMRSLPVVQQTLEGGFSYEKALSRTRHVELSAGGGAMQIEAVSRLAEQPFEQWTPTGHATVRTDIGRTWAVSAAYRRGVTFLDGITPEFFVANVALIRTQGMVGRRVELTLSAGYSDGAQRVGLATDRYDTYTLAADSRIVIARSWSVVVSYNRSDYHLSGFLSPTAEPTSRYDRNAIRLGLIYSFTQSSSRAERPRRPARTES